MNTRRCIACLFLVLFVSLAGISQELRLKVQTGHSSFISGLAFNDAGDLLFTGSIDGTIKAWDPTSAREIFSQPTGSLVLSMVPSGETAVISADLNGFIHKWDLETGKVPGFPEIRYIPGHLAVGFGSTIGSLARSPDGTRFILANAGSYEDNILKLDKVLGSLDMYDMDGRKLTSFKKNASAITSLAFMGNEKLVTADKEGMVAIWDVARGKISESLSTGGAEVKTVAGTTGQCAAGFSDGSIIVWSDSGKELFRIPATGTPVDHLDYSRDGSRIVGTYRNTAKVWDASGGSEILNTGLENVSGGFANTYQSSIFDPSAKLLYSSWFGTVSVYDIRTGRLLRTFQGNSNGLIGNSMSGNVPVTYYMGPDYILSKVWTLPEVRTQKVNVNVAGSFIVVSPTVEHILVWDPRAAIADLYELETGILVTRLEGHAGVIKKATFSPDGKLIATGSQDNTIRIWEVTSGEELKIMKAFTDHGLLNMSGDLFFSQDNQKIFSMGLANGPAGKIWDIATGKSRTISSQPFIGSSGTLSPDGRFVAGLEGREGQPVVIVYDTDTKEEVTFIQDAGMYIEFSADSRGIAVSNGNDVGLYQVTSGNLMSRFNHRGVNHFAFSGDGSRMLTSGGDGMSRLWDLSTGEEIAALVSYKEEENTIVLPEGYYFSSKGAVEGLHYVKDRKAYSFDQFDLVFNRPDKILEVLDDGAPALVTAYEKAYQKRVEKTGVQPTIDKVGELPQVELSSEAGVSTTEKEFQLNIQARSEDAPITSIRIFVNNVPIPADTQPEVPETGSWDGTVTLTLSTGRNRITAVALNKDGVRSLEEVLEVQFTGDVEAPDLYILAMGISKYQEPGMDLKYADKDARDLSRYFESNQGIYSKVRVRTLLNEEVTVENILSASQFLKEARENDRIIVFYAGHGLLDGDLDYYLTTFDIRFVDPSEKGLRYELLESILANVRSRNKMLIIDACHSGEVDKEDESLSTELNSTTSGEVTFRSVKSPGNSVVGLQNSFRLMTDLFTDLRRGSGTMVISAAGGLEVAIEDDQWNGGVFTYSLLDCLVSEECDLDGDGSLRVSEMREYVIRRVNELSGGRQVPTARAENYENDFIIR